MTGGITHSPSGAHTPKWSRNTEASGKNVASTPRIEQLLASIYSRLLVPSGRVAPLRFLKSQGLDSRSVRTIRRGKSQSNTSLHRFQRPLHVAVSQDTICDSSRAVTSEKTWIEDSFEASVHRVNQHLRVCLEYCTIFLMISHPWQRPVLLSSLNAQDQ